MMTARPTSVTLQGTSAQIAAQWGRQMTGLSSGDLVVLRPDGGVLELERPLTIPGDVVVTGLAGAQGGGGGAAGRRRRLLAAEPGAAKGAATVKCGKGAGTAFRIM
jgi:hypothetical protein